MSPAIHETLVEHPVQDVDEAVAACGRDEVADRMLRAARKAR